MLCLLHVLVLKILLNSDLGGPGGLGGLRHTPTSSFAPGFSLSTCLGGKISWCNEWLYIVIFSQFRSNKGESEKPEAGPSFKRFPRALPNWGRLRNGNDAANHNAQFWIYQNYIQNCKRISIFPNHPQGEAFHLMPGEPGREIQYVSTFIFISIYLRYSNILSNVDIQIFWKI